MESENISTYHESFKNQTDKESFSEYSNRITRNTYQVNPITSTNEKQSFIRNKEEDKINETLPIKNCISSFKYKIVLIGDVAVGKSSIIKRYVNNEFNSNYVLTISTELSTKSLLISENKKVNLLIWDTCGQERFRSVTRQYYRDTQAILLVFDLTNEKTFNDMQSWYDEAVEYANEVKCMFFLLGNKSDEDNKIKVKEKDIKNFMRKNHKIKKYFDVSAFNGHNIDLTFDKISQYLVMTFGIEEINKNIRAYKKNMSLEIGNEEHSTKTVKCC